MCRERTEGAAYLSWFTQGNRLVENEKENR